MTDKAKARLRAAGVEVDDRQRPTEGRKRKQAGIATGPGLRDEPGLPMRNIAHEQYARNYASGMPLLDAWVHAGYSPRNRDWLEISRHADFIDRVAEIQQADREATPVPLGYLQRRLLAIANSDIANYFEPAPGGRMKAKDVLSLPPELRAAIAEVNYDKYGRPVLKFHDRTRALDALAKLGAPQRVEVSGPGGGPMQIDAMVQNLPNLSDADLAQLEAIAARAAGQEPAAEPDALAAGVAVGIAAGVSVEVPDAD